MSHLTIKHHFRSFMLSIRSFPFLVEVFQSICHGIRSQLTDRQSFSFLYSQSTLRQSLLRMWCPQSQERCPHISPGQHGVHTVDTLVLKSNNQLITSWIHFPQIIHLPGRIVFVSKLRISTSRSVMVLPIVQLSGSLPALVLPPTMTISFCPESNVTRLHVCPHRGVVIVGPSVHSWEVRFRKPVLM